MVSSVNRKLSSYFWLKEFGYIEPEEDLLRVLTRLRMRTRDSVIITDAGRTILDHIQLYKKKYGKKWLDKIPWNSRHLAKFGSGLRAVDFKAVKRRSKSGRILAYYTGEELYEMLTEICEELHVIFACGIGKKYVHFDVDRTHHPDPWYYYKKAA